MSGKEVGYTYSKLVTASGSDSLANSSSLTNFTIDLGSNLQKVKRISIASVTFPNNAWNVNTTGGGANNTFAVNINGTVTVYSVQGGFWNTGTLMTAVQTAVQGTLTGLGDGQTFTLTQDPISQLVEATYGAGTSGVTFITLEEGETTFGVWDLLGFSPPTVVTTTTEAINVPSLGGLKEVYLCSNTLAYGNMFDKGGLQRNVLIAIPITAMFGVSNVFECKQDDLCQITYMLSRPIGLVDFYLTDKQGNLVDLHGGNLVINLRVWFDRF